MELIANATRSDLSPQETLHPVYYGLAAVLLVSLVGCLMALVRRSTALLNVE